MAATLPACFSQFETASERLLACVPAWLLLEHDFRRTLAEIVLACDPVFYGQAEHLQLEKLGDGVPARRSVDLYCVVDGVPHFFQFKFWKTIIKAKDGRREIGRGNYTDNDYHELLNDFAKLAWIANPRAERYLICLSQVQQYPGSRSKLVSDYAHARDPENAAALFDDGGRRGRVLSTESGPVPFVWARDPLELVSHEGIRFRLFVYHVGPAL
jgi:hypothetical protein